MTTDNKWVFLGYDLRALYQYWLWGWREFFYEKTFFTSSELVDTAKVTCEDGTTYFTRNFQKKCEPCDTNRQILLLSEKSSLAKSYVLPRSTENNLSAFVAGEVSANSPFEQHEVSVGWRVVRRFEEKIEVVIVIVQKSFVDSLLAKHNLQTSEVSVEYKEHVIGVAGYAEASSEDNYRKRLTILGILFSLCLLVVMALMITPVGFKYLELREVQTMYELTKGQSLRRQK